MLTACIQKLCLGRIDHVNSLYTETLSGGIVGVNSLYISNLVLAG